MQKRLRTAEKLSFATNVTDEYSSFDYFKISRILMQYYTHFLVEPMIQIVFTTFRTYYCNNFFFSFFHLYETIRK